jgi:hypothetical protein
MADIKCRICGGSIRMGICELCCTKYSMAKIRQLAKQSRNRDALMLLQRNDVRILEAILKNNTTSLWKIN